MICLVSCDFITKLPDLCCPNLEELDLCNCKNLIEVHESIGFLEKLKVWILCNCSQLQILPSTLMLKSLEYFVLSSCKRLEKLPDMCCPNLEIFDLNNCKNLIEVHKSIGFLEKLKKWDLTGCSQLQILPSTLILKSLEYFGLGNCSRLEKFPDIHPDMNCLLALDLTCSGIRELPSSLLYQTGLDNLSLNGSKLTNFLVGANKSQMREEEDIPFAN